MLKLAEQFKHINVSKSAYNGCVMCLTSVTSNGIDTRN